MSPRTWRKRGHDRCSADYSLVPLSSGSASSSSSSCSSPELSPQLVVVQNVELEKLCDRSITCGDSSLKHSVPAAYKPSHTRQVSAVSLPGLDELRTKLHKLCLRMLSVRSAPRAIYIVFLASLLLLLVLTIRASEHALSGISWINSAILDECSWHVPESEQLASLTARKATSPPPKPSSEQTAALTEMWTSLQSIADGNWPRPLTGIPRPKSQDGVRNISAETLDNLVEFDETDAMASRAAFLNFTQHVPVYPKHLFAGRGVVMIAGGRYSGYAAIALGSLRLTGTTLPVEMWMPHKSDDPDNWCDELLTSGAQCKFFTDYIPSSLLYGPSPQFSHGYQYKVLAMLLSSFEEVLLLDADNHALTIVDGIFDAPTYREHHSLFWPDYWTHTGSPWLPYVMGLSEQKSAMLVGGPTVESGQLLWHKRQRWRSLVTALYLNYYGPSHFYSLISQGFSGQGDKDTFDIALKASNESSHFIPQPVRTAFAESTGQGIAMLQANPHNENGRPMFMHANIHKMSIDGVSDSESLFGTAIRNDSRAFRLKELVDRADVDPESSLWRVLQHTACWSRVYGNRKTCLKVRKHRSRTFNMSLPPHRSETQPKWACGVGRARFGTQHVVGASTRNMQEHFPRRGLPAT